MSAELKTTDSRFVSLNSSGPVMILPHDDTDGVFDSLSNQDFKLLLSDTSSDDPVPSTYELNSLDCNYWDSPNISKFLVDNNNNNSNSNLLIHFNIQCLAAKFDNLQTFLDSFNLNNSDRCIPAFIALSETWLNDLNAPTFKINNYHPPLTKNRNDRTSRGGVAIYVREDINFVPRPEFSIFIPFVFESVFITVKSINLTIGVIYTSPQANPCDFIEQYRNVLNLLTQSNEKFILAGDFNVNLLDYNSDSIVNEFVKLNLSNVLSL